MSPAPIKGKDSNKARLVGSGLSGFAELAIFHPVDTIVKRLMSNELKNTSGQMSRIIFKDYANAPAMTKALSLFPGLGYAAVYKVSQRIYKFGGQPYFNDILDSRYKDTFRNTFGEKQGKMLLHAAAGSMTGIGEVVLLPFDVLKIKRQTNPEAFRGRGLLRIIKDEGFSLYNGWGWTMARNAPGSFALFGGSAITKSYLFKLDDYSSATWFQNFCSSIGGTLSSITVAAPLDVIKTRIQKQNFESKVNGFTLVKNLIKNEGPGAFFKGLPLKMVIVGPKLVFSFTLAQTLIPFFGKFI